MDRYFSDIRYSSLPLEFKSRGAFNTRLVLCLAQSVGWASGGRGFRSDRSPQRDAFGGIGMSLALAVYDPHLSAFLASWKFDLLTYSMLLCATGAGAAAGALGVRLAWGKVNPTLLLRLGVLVFSLSILAAALAMVLAPAWVTHEVLIALWFANGLGYELFSVGSAVITQNLCPPALLGRISTSVRSLKLITMVLGPSLGVWLITEYSRTSPFVAAAGLGVLLTLTAWRASSTLALARKAPAPSTRCG
jgi:MFS family permease